MIYRKIENPNGVVGESIFQEIPEQDVRNIIEEAAEESYKVAAPETVCCPERGEYYNPEQEEGMPLFPLNEVVNKALSKLKKKN